MYDSISIIGDGGMGTVLAMMLCQKGVGNHEVKIWGYNAEQLAEMEQARENKKFLPGYKLPRELIFESDDSLIMAGADLIVSAVPCQYMRSIWKRLKEEHSLKITVPSVYQHLSELEALNLLRKGEALPVIGERKRRYYTLTGKGKEALQLELKC